jgi:hypothetical protein
MKHAGHERCGKWQMIGDAVIPPFLPLSTIPMGYSARVAYQLLEWHGIKTKDNSATVAGKLTT